jgi:hypothetical protein
LVLLGLVVFGEVWGLNLPLATKINETLWKIFPKGFLIKILMQNFYLYILRNKVTDKFYIGSTENLELRLGRHNSG